MSKDIKKWSYETEIKYLDSENEQLKEQVDNLRQDLQNRCDRCIELNNENEELKKLISNLVSEKTRLQNELFSEHLKQVETEDFIDKLKKELKEYRGY